MYQRDFGDMHQLGINTIEGWVSQENIPEARPVPTDGALAALSADYLSETTTADAPAGRG